MNIVKRYRIYKDYTKIIKSAMPELNKDFDMNINQFNEIFTVLDLTTTPDYIKNEHGSLWEIMEINKFKNVIYQRLQKYNLLEECSILDVKKLDDCYYGITFGIKENIWKPRKWLLTKLILAFLGLITFIVGLLILI